MTDARPSLLGQLPVRCEPRPGESLFGLGLRLDDELGGPSGTIAHALARHAVGMAELANPAHQVIGTIFDLDLLAEVGQLSRADVARLTLAPVLRAIFGPKAGPGAIGGPVTFRICPDCARERLVTLEATLPLVSLCDRHGLRLVSRCDECDAELVAFDGVSEPFTCPCGLAWSALHHEGPTAQEWLMQRRILAAYRWLADHPSSHLPRTARRIVELAPPGRWSGGFEAACHQPQDLRSGRYPGSLKAIVSLLVERNLPPGRLAEREPSARTALQPCRNKTCRAGREAIRRNGWRAGTWETYCAECGSRFLGDRVILSFDLDHGDPRLRRRSVLRARARLVRFRVAVYKAAVELRRRQPDGSIGIEDVFRAAGVPLAGYLRAGRLGLTAVASSALHGFPPQPDWIDRYAPLDARWRPPWPIPQRRTYWVS